MLVQLHTSKYMCSNFNLNPPIIEVKTFLGALSKTFVGIELDRGVMLGSIMLIRVKSARVTAI